MKFKTNTPPKDRRYLILAKICDISGGYTSEYYSILRYNDETEEYIDVRDAETAYVNEDIVGYCIIEKSRDY